MSDRRREDSTAADRQRRRRQRRADGSVPVVVDVPGDLQSRLVMLELLDPDEVGDRQALARALRDLMDEISDGGAVTP